MDLDDVMLISSGLVVPKGVGCRWITSVKAEPCAPVICIPGSPKARDSGDTAGLFKVP